MMLINLRFPKIQQKLCVKVIVKVVVLKKGLIVLSSE